MKKRKKKKRRNTRKATFSVPPSCFPGDGRSHRFWSRRNHSIKPPFFTKRGRECESFFLYFWKRKKVAVSESVDRKTDRSGEFRIRRIFPGWSCSPSRQTSEKLDTASPSAVVQKNATLLRAARIVLEREISFLGKAIVFERRIFPETIFHRPKCISSIPGIFSPPNFILPVVVLRERSPCLHASVKGKKKNPTHNARN